MSLPFADKPGQSSIYQDLKTKTLQELTPDQFDAFRARMLSQGTDGLEDEYRRLLLLGMASDKLSTAGPIPGTMELIDQTFTTPNTYKDYYTPDTGTVYQLLGVSIGSSTGLSGAGSLEVDVTNLTTGDRLIVADFSFTSSSDFPVVESGAMSPVYVDSNHKVKIRAEGTFTSINNVVLGVIRVR